MKPIEELDTLYKELLSHKNKTQNLYDSLMKYANKKKININNFLATMKIKDFKVKEYNGNLDEESIKTIENWLKLDSKKILDDNTYKLDLVDKVFFFKYFEIQNGDGVITGYVIEDSFNIRIFFAHFSEQKIQEKYAELMSKIYLEPKHD